VSVKYKMINKTSPHTSEPIMAGLVLPPPVLGKNTLEYSHTATPIDINREMTDKDISIF